jgi:hypothetical protein
VLDNDTFTVEMEYSTVIQGAPAIEGDAGSSAAATPGGSVAGLSEPHSRLPSPAQAVAERGSGQTVELATPPTIDEEHLDANHEDDMQLRSEQWRICSV